MKHFRSFQNVPLVNQPEHPPTKEEMAADLALEMCEVIKTARAEALRREEQCESPLPPTKETLDAQATLDALMKGPHKWVVTPVILEQFPELVRPPTEVEKRAVDAYLQAQEKPCM